MRLKKIRKNDHSLHEQVEGFFKVSDSTLRNLQLDLKNLIIKSFKATIQIYFDIFLFDRFD